MRPLKLKPWHRIIYGLDDLSIPFYHSGECREGRNLLYRWVRTGAVFKVDDLDLLKSRFPEVTVQLGRNQTELRFRSAAQIERDRGKVRRRGRNWNE